MQYRIKHVFLCIDAEDGVEMTLEGLADVNVSEKHV